MRQNSSNAVVQHPSTEETRTAAALEWAADVLEKAGTEWIDPAVRDRMAQALGALGDERRAGRLRETNARRSGWGRADLQAVPADPRRPLKSPQGRRPILEIHEGGGEAAAMSDEDAFWADITRLTRRHSAPELSLPARLALDALRRLADPAGA